MIETDVFWYDEETKEINLNYGKELTLNICGDHTVYLDKLYGPLIFCGVRITADIESGNWIIEREVIKQDDAGNDIPNVWEKVCEFDGQESIHFRDE